MAKKKYILKASYQCGKTKKKPNDEISLSETEALSLLRLGMIAEIENTSKKIPPVVTEDTEKTDNSENIDNIENSEKIDNSDNSENLEKTEDTENTGEVLDLENLDPDNMEE